ncbi:succinate dehydrogenase cytochrome b560 subunit, mitochondrial [Fopius arisanus]|uniref:Succinate dehydrogenase cytochrome b560 subunit, mitochondrial n=1 Tax=Fopius arisanus TaxID=64838 RepID=A0A9R1U330_9HYME|nr:PREDICTED: succinate dehydrogenase cytochrome b560 subunit, mitochondrial-like [Fopius arisanus]XP_011305337.1 PREDICTED: succinate dehydrogenase cytochrome b560 subunit, mitochondrial-like [Fopius arisanus]
MALSYTRLFCQKGFNAGQFKSILTPSSMGLSSTMSRCVAVQACESYAEKNKRLKRPMSPHLTIYKPQLTSMLSITHRGTGMALAFYATGAGAASLFLPGGMNCVLDSIAAMELASPLLFLMKFAVAWPTMYHYLNGIRHLAWDMGQFLTIKQVYSTGWTMLGLSVVSAFILSLM